MKAKVAVVGLGRLGLPFAIVANRYHEVIGLDIDENRLEAIKKNSPMSEPLANDYLAESPLKVSSRSEDVKDVSIIFIFVNTENQCEYSSRSVLRVLESILPFAENKTIVINCTLEPGVFRNEIIPLLERKKMLSRILGICYNPVMVAIGEAIQYFERPSFILIGQSNEAAGQACERFYEGVFGGKVPIIRSSLENVEVAKYVLNLALISRISMMNFLGEYCEKNDGDVDFLAKIFQYDQRITGKKMLKAGLGFGGPCFPLDSRAFRKTLEKKGIPTDFVDSIVKVNNRQQERIVDLILSLNKKTVAILGVTYKPGVSYTAESQALDIAKQLQKNMNVKIYDPQGIPNAKKELGQTNISFCRSTREAIETSDVILIAVPWEEFVQLDPAVFGSNQIVIDPWRVFRNVTMSARYIPLGMSAVACEEGC